MLFIAALDDAARFEGAAQVTSYLGLVPREYSSGEHQHRGRICAVRIRTCNRSSFKRLGA